MIKHLKLTATTLALAAMLLMPITSLTSAETVSKTTQTETKSKYTGKAVADVKTNLNIRKSPSKNADIIGKMEKGNLAQVLDKQEEWTKIKSGSVTGYVSNDYLVYGDDIETYAEKNVKQIATVETETLRVRKKTDTSSDIMTLVDEGDELTAKKAEDGWIKVTTSEGKGYVSEEYVETEYQFGKAKSMEEIAEEEARKEAEKRAEEARKAAAAKASSSSSVTSSGSTTTSSSSKTSSSGSAATSTGSSSSSSGTTSSTGSSVASYALQFVGNPYKWGGSSLTNGADCSGFTMAVYAHFGYSLPHSSTSQRGSGVAVSSENRQAGDLICYDTKNGTGHVGIYVGNNQVVHAGSSSTGIHVSTWNYRSVNCVRRIIR